MVGSGLDATTTRQRNTFRPTINLLSHGNRTTKSSPQVKFSLLRKKSTHRGHPDLLVDLLSTRHHDGITTTRDYSKLLLSRNNESSTISCRLAWAAPNVPHGDLTAPSDLGLMYRHDGGPIKSSVLSVLSSRYAGDIRYTELGELNKPPRVCFSDADFADAADDRLRST